MKARRLDELLVFRKALSACDAVSAFTRTAAVREDFELRSQMRSASAAVPANIAEGFGQQSDRQFIRYLYIARGSSHEIRTLLMIARGRHYLGQDDFARMDADYEEVARMLTGLIRYLQQSNRKSRG